MATKKIGDSTRNEIMEICRNALIAAGYDVLQVASGSLGIPAVENGEETSRHHERPRAQKPERTGMD